MEIEDFGYSSFRQVMRDATRVGDDVVFDFGSGTEVTVLDVSKSDFRRRRLHPVLTLPGAAELGRHGVPSDSPPERAPEPTPRLERSAPVSVKGQDMVINGTPGSDELLGTNRDDVIPASAATTRSKAAAVTTTYSATPASTTSPLAMATTSSAAAAAATRSMAARATTASRAGGGNDELEGDDGRDLLFGGTGNDDLFGGDDDDELFGDRGRDHVEGGAGRRRPGGRRGSDTFEFDPGDGSDTIVDWNRGGDVIDLDDFDYANFREVMDEAFRVGDDLVFNLDDDVEITVLGARRATSRAATSCSDAAADVGSG